MAYPPQYREPAPALPSIRVPSADSFRHHASHHDIPFGSSPAMSIPGIKTQDNVPPPLPPPRYVPGTEPPLHSDDMRERRDYGHGPASFLSNYGSMTSSSFAEDRASFRRKDTASAIGDKDEGYASYSTERSRESYPNEFVGLHHNRFQFKSPADIHGDSMKQKLNPSRTAAEKPSPPRSLLSSSMASLSRRPPMDNRYPPQLSLPVELPYHTRGILDSPARLTETPLHSAISPRAATFHYGDRSPMDSDIDRSPRTRSRRNNSDDATSTKSYEWGSAEEMEIEETSSLKRLHIDDAYMAGSQKRRAASPQDEHLLAAQPDLLLRRRDMGSRGSPTPRLGTIPQGTSISSISSASRSNSYMSTMSIPASITTANTFGRRSPNGFSPGGISPTSCNSPYTTPISLNPSPRTSISGRSAVHTRTISGASPRKLTEVQKPGGSKMGTFFMCECCPKKPKKFETEQELNAHEAEKQYECSFCGNRFKNKNEAERHQNSLHVRRHSWSCSALSGYDRAFHESTNRPGEADSCGYCGEEFPRSGRGPGAGALSGGSAPRHATEQDWDERIRHLQEIHKFRECNSSKKFYRADHFRQHLKHSHAGTSGKWTNMLENACMLEEDPTPSGQPEDKDDTRLQQWEDFGHEFEEGELELLKRSIAEMALSRIEGEEGLYVGGIWALRRSDSLTDRHITHVLSLVPFNLANMKNFKDEPWTDYGKAFKHLVIDIDDVDDADLLAEFPKAVKFIDEGLRGTSGGRGEVEDKEAGGVDLADGVKDLSLEEGKKGAVFVHCAAGKSRSVATTIAYLLWRHPNRFNPNITPTALSDPTHAVPNSDSAPRSRKDTAEAAVHAALTFIRRTRPMAEPNDGFMAQLALWWEMGCPDDVETHPIYQRWAYKREVEENLAIGQAPTRLRFEDEELPTEADCGLSLRCKKCRRTLVTAPFILPHKPPQTLSLPCPHFFIEPLSWMRSTLEQGELNGRLMCPNTKCGAGVGRYDWKGFKCSCGGWVCPAFSLQRGKVDDVVKRASGAEQNMGIRMPPGAGGRGGNL
ncbi:Fc.00g095930.m01.CDS01 [Cosmosporella sp. VM-42]